MTVVLLVGAELFFRYCAPITYLAPLSDAQDDMWRTGIHQASTVPGLDYELRPNLDIEWHGMHVRTNSQGMRNPERTKNKPTGIIRIAAVGDSYTFGLGVKESETWPASLERLLNEGDGRHEVLNFGVCGYNSKDEALVIRHKVMAWGPDLIVVGYVMNDPEIEPVQPLHAYFHAPTWWQHSALIRAILLAERNYHINITAGGSLARYWHMPNAARWKSVVTAFRDMASAAAEQDVPIMVVIFPDPPLGVPHEHFLRQIYRQVADTACAQGFRTVILADFLDGRDYNDLRLPEWGNHLNAQAYDLVARAVRLSIDLAAGGVTAAR